MFYYVSGNLTVLDPTFAVIDCAGVGYQLSISTTTYDALARSGGYTATGDASGKKARLYTYLSVTQDAFALYGFYTVEECNLFKMLITVSGVGPKAALAVLSAHSADSFAAAVAANDAKAIARANGVGLKTAQKIILELKDKVAKGFDLAGAPSDVGTGGAYMPSSVAGEAIEALTVLGYSESEAAKAVRASGGATVEDCIRGALALLMKR